MRTSSRIDSAVERSALVGETLRAARAAHGKQTRETGSGEIPFLDHVIAVAERLAEEGYGEEALAAALLHDSLEQDKLGTEELRERFGPQVADLVEALSEDAAIEDYEDRKEEHRKRVAAASPEARAVFAADKTANVVVLHEAYADAGEEVSEQLPVSLDRKILVWEYDLEMLFDELPGTLVDRFAEEMIGLWGQRAEEERTSLA